MRVRILGSGTSTGVPEVGCSCPVCTSEDVRDQRLRTSVLVCTEDARILLDCGPDFRQQMMSVRPFASIDGVLISHEHYDHVGGLDDLRPFSRLNEIPLYCDTYTANHLRQRIPYCFAEQKYPGVPCLKLQEVQAGELFFIRQTGVLPIQVMHGRLPILGYRVAGRFAYITDMLTMPDESFEQLKGVEVLVLNALRKQPHATHQSLDEALRVAARIGARQTYLIHMSHHAGLHAALEKELPENVFLAYDGLEISF